MISCDGDENGDACQPLSTVLASHDVNASATIPAGCWLVETDLMVYNGATLTIAPGAELRFTGNYNLEVDPDSALVAAGTAAQPILLTAQVAQRGAWGGVILRNSDSALNELAFVTVEYAGGYEMLDSGARPFRAAVVLDSSGFPVRARISDSTLRQSAGFGLSVAATTTTLGDFAGNVLTENATGAVHVYAAAAHLLSDGSSYSGNDADLVFVDGAYEFGDTPRAWATLDAPYVVDGVFILYTHLTLSPGASLYFTAGSGMRFINELAGITAVGTAAKPILFSGTEATPGHWNGLYFANTEDSSAPRSRLAHVTIEYGGAYTFQDANAEDVRGNLLLDSSGWSVGVELNDVTLADSTGYGLWLDCLAETTGGGATYSGNAWGDWAREDNCS
jgi:hypothetical protein